MLLRPSIVELQDLNWLPGCRPVSAAVSFKKLFRVGLNSRLTDALNNDIALKDILIQGLKEQWDYPLQGIRIVGDRRNGCVRITSDASLTERELLDILPSRELMQALDKIAAHIKSVW